MNWPLGILLFVAFVAVIFAIGCAYCDAPEIEENELPEDDE